MKLLFFLLFLLLNISCAKHDRGHYFKISGFAQGTTWNITYATLDSVNLKPSVDSILKAFDMSMSTYVPNSIISRVNRNEDVSVDDYFRGVFHTARKVWEESDGYFDITVMPLVDAWGFGPGKKMEIDSTVIDSLMQFVGMDKIWLEGNKVRKKHPNVSIDMSAIAKGFSVDVVCRYFDSLGLDNYMVEIGGEIRTKGVNPSGESWKIGVDRPSFDHMIPGSQLQVILKLSNNSLATSGNYRNFYERDGVMYAHTINPKTGYTVYHNLLSVTVIAKDCMTADAWATAFMAMGLEKSKEVLETQRNFQAYLIYGDMIGQYKVYTTSGLKPYILNDMAEK